MLLATGELPASSPRVPKITASSFIHGVHYIHLALGQLNPDQQTNNRLRVFCPVGI